MACNIGRVLRKLKNTTMVRQNVKDAIKQISTLNIKKIIAIFLIMYFCRILMSINNTSKANDVGHPVDLEYVVVHIDLKGMPPKLKYLESLLNILKDRGVNGLLIEYEDMFPYEGRLANLSAKYHYGKKELANFLKVAVSKGFEIIPLIQTLGHMEFALKLKEFEHLLESKQRMDSICPSQKESIQLISDMLFQVIDFHKAISPLKYVHVGCDEVQALNECPFCKQRHLAKATIFMEHIHTVANIVQKLAPGAMTLIWNDMFFVMDRLHLESKNLTNDIGIVYWDYRTDFALLHAGLYQQHKLFDEIWIATAFKGADGKTSILPNLLHRAFNHNLWINYILDYKFGGEKEVYKFKGIIITGWSRYNHFAPICDILVPSLPSLLLDLRIVQRYRTGNYNPIHTSAEIIMDVVTHELKYDLSCEKELTFDDIKENKLSTCKFTGYEVFDELSNLVAFKKNVSKQVEDKLYKKMYFDYIFNDWCESLIKKFNIFKWKLQDLLKPYYDKRLIKEYVGMLALEANHSILMCFTYKTTSFPPVTSSA